MLMLWKHARAVTAICLVPSPCPEDHPCWSQGTCTQIQPTSLNEQLTTRTYARVVFPFLQANLGEEVCDRLQRLMAHEVVVKEEGVAGAAPRPVTPPQEAPGGRGLTSVVRLRILPVECFLCPAYIPEPAVDDWCLSRALEPVGEDDGGQGQGAGADAAGQVAVVGGVDGAVSAGAGAGPAGAMQGGSASAMEMRIALLQRWVAELPPDGGKLKFSKLLPRQPDEAGAGTTPEFFAMEQVGGAPGMGLEVQQLRSWWKGGQEQHCVTGAWDEDSATAGGDQDARAPGSSVPAAAIEQDAIAVKPTAVYAPAQAAEALTRAAISLDPIGVGTGPNAGAFTAGASTAGASTAGASTAGASTAGASTSNNKATTIAADVAAAAAILAPATDADRAAAQRALSFDWQGGTPLEQLWREAAAVLLQQREGEGGPLGRHSQLSVSPWGRGTARCTYRDIGTGSIGKAVSVS